MALNIGNRLRIRSITASYTATRLDDMILANSTSGAITITLPNVLDAVNKLITIKRTNAGSNAITISGGTIDGVSSKVLSFQYDYVRLLSDGTQWYIVDSMEENVNALRQYTPTITGTNWTTYRAVCVPYKTVDGTWRIKFNIVGAFSSGTDNVFTATFSGVTFKTSSGYGQAITVHDDSGQSHSAIRSCSVLNGTSTIRVLLSAIISYGATYGFSGDVELDGKPTFVP